MPARTSRPSSTARCTAYYTPEQILKTLHRCEEVGINAWQSDPQPFGDLSPLRGRRRQDAFHGPRGRRSPRIAQEAGRRRLHRRRPSWRNDRQPVQERETRQVNEYLKQVRDAGMQVGVSTHMPAVVDAIESKGWDLDYYMTCVYERHRSEADLKKLLGHVPLPVGEVYLKSDPPRMFKAIQHTKRPCLAFKILAAGRLSERREWVEQAFRETFAAIKPTDGVIVGIYDRYGDQPAEDAALVRRFG